MKVIAKINGEQEFLDKAGFKDSWMIKDSDGDWLCIYFITAELHEYGNLMHKVCQVKCIESGEDVSDEFVKVLGKAGRLMNQNELKHKLKRTMKNRILKDGWCQTKTQTKFLTKYRLF